MHREPASNHDLKRIGLFLLSGAFLLLVALTARWLSPPSGLRAEAAAATTAAETASGKTVLAAAQVVFEGMGKGEKKRALFPFASEERTDWHFIPRSRKGVALAQLFPDKQEKVLALLRASLSARGFEKAEQVRSLEGILRGIEGEGRRFARDPFLYHVSFFGEPSDTEAWGWRFEGHHLALNFTLQGNKLVSATPAFFGANPGTVRGGPQDGLRVLGGAEDLARKLVQALDAKERSECLGSEVPDEVPDTQKARYSGPFPAGIPASKLDAEEKKLLRQLLLEYRRDLTADAPVSIASEDPSLEGVHFAWGGSIQAGEGHSYLIHGPGFVINYANTQNDANHVHASLRERERDFGGSR